MSKDTALGWMRIGLAVLVLTSVTSGSLFFTAPSKVLAWDFPTYQKGWTGQATEAWFAPIPSWRIGQDASVKVTFRKDFPFHGLPVYAAVMWTDCSASALGIEIDVTWCGASRINRYTLDFGFNFTKKPLRGIVGSEDCWVRQKLTWDRWNHSTPVKGEKRMGCG